MVGRSTIKEEYSPENFESQELRKEVNNPQDKQGESLAQQQKNELDNSSSFNNYEDSNTTQNKSSFSSKEDLPNPEDKTPISQGTKEMKELQDKGSWKTVEKKKKATTLISPRKTRGQTVKN